MYVRWQTYRSQALNFWHAENNDRRARLKAILVESARVDGKPRQKHVAFLGSIATGNSIDGIAGKRFLARREIEAQASGQPRRA